VGFRSGAQQGFLEFLNGLPGSTVLHCAQLCFGLFGALQGSGELCSASLAGWVELWPAGALARVHNKSRETAQFPLRSVPDSAVMSFALESYAHRD
jgi:hypothetical protein